MAHIDYDKISSLDALIDVSDASARASMLRLREQLARLDAELDQRIVNEGLHRKPAIALYRDGEVLLHIFPEPGAANGLHVAIPIREYEQDLIETSDLPDWLREAIAHAKHQRSLWWIEATIHSPRMADDLALLLERRLELMPRLH